MMRPLTTPMFEILTALIAGPLHGYAIAKRILALHGNATPQMGPATLYNSIDKLLGLGYIAELPAKGPDTRRKTYKITYAGATAQSQAMRAHRQFLDNASSGQAGPLIGMIGGAR